jgi:PAS domain S-box-containing protein
LRARLLTLAAVPLVTVGALVLFLIVLQALRKQDEAEASAMRIARSLAVAVESRLREVEASLTVLAVSRPLQQQDLEAFHAQAVTFQEATGLGTVVVLDAAGRQVVNTSLPLGAPLPALGASAPALPVIKTGKPMARVVSAALAGKPIAVVAVPVRIQGEVRYALSTAIDFQRIDGLLREQRLPPSWIGVVLDPERIVVARTGESARYVGTPASKSLREALAVAPEGAFDGVSLDGIAVRTLYTSASDVGWSVAVGVPKSELARDLYVSLAWFALTALFVFGLAVAWSWRYAARIGDVVEKLNHAARALGHGDEVSLEPLGIQEADQLAAALSRASADLQNAHDVLARNEARWSAVLESAMDGIIAVDDSMRIVVYNPAAQSIFGWDRDDVLGQPLEMLIPPAQRAGHEALMRGFGRTGAIPRRMGGARLVSGLRKSGEVFPVEASISHLETDAGQLYTVIVRDVTPPVKAPHR